MKKLFLSLAAALVMTGCAQSQLSPEGDAIFYALQADTMMNMWGRECGEVSGRANYVAESARADWWRRNGEFVKGADFGLAYNMVTVTDERVETGARMAMAMTWEVQKRAENTVVKRLDGASDKEKLCLKVLGEYSKGKWDIEGSEEMQSTLLDLKSMSVERKDDFDLRRGMIETSTGKRYGRSLYVVEKLAEKMNCDKAGVKLIKGAWPYEVYNVDCADKPLLLMRCEWGNCAAIE